MNDTHLQLVQQLIRGEAVQQVVRDETKIGRNDPCPCASGNKYKKCCGSQADEHLDIYLRAHTEKFCESEKPKKSRKQDTKQPERWPDHCLIVDTETRVDVHQRLMFGVYRVCKLVDGAYRVEKEGIVYSGTSETAHLSYSAVLDEKELNTIGTFVLNSPPDIEVKQFPPQIRLEVHRSFPEFMHKVFWPAVRKGWLCVFFNAPFDLSRLSCDWRPTRKNRGFSLVLSKQLEHKTQNWIPHPYRPEISIEAKDARTAFIKRGLPRFRKDEWQRPGRFLDLSTLLYSLFDKHMSLEAWGDELRKKGYTIDHKIGDGTEGIVNIPNLRHCQRDVKITQQTLNAAITEFNRHPLPALLPDACYSPASIAKAYMREGGLETHKVSAEINGKAMQSYFGGRAECHIRRTPVPVMRLDFVSQYCTVHTLLKNFDVLKAASVEFPDATDEIKRFLSTITLDKCFNPSLWTDFRFFALVQPDHDAFPVRAPYNRREKDKLNIGLNYLTSEKPIWFAGPDIIACILINKGKVPNILKAFLVVESTKKQEGLNTVYLLGKIPIDFNTEDFYREVVEQKEANKEDETLKKGLKCIGNAGAYGPLVELNESPLTQRRHSVSYSCPSCEHIPFPTANGWKKHMKSVHGGWIKDQLKHNTVKEKIRLNHRLNVYSGEHFDCIDAPKEIEVGGEFYFPPIASLITSGGRLLLAMAQKCVEDANGKILFCDTDSLCIVANEKDGHVKPLANKPEDDDLSSKEFDRIPCLSRETVRKISDGVPLVVRG